MKGKRSKTLFIIMMSLVVFAVFVVFKFNIKEYKVTKIDYVEENLKNNFNNKITEILKGKIKGEWVYYSNLEDSEKLYKIKIDGTQKKKLNNTASHVIDVVGGWIYYTSHKSGYDGIYKINTDGKKNVKILGGEKGNCADGIKIIDKKIYYYDWYNNLFCSADIDGKNKIVIEKDIRSSIHIQDDWVYFLNNDRNIYKIKTDGSSKMKINNIKTQDFYILDDWIYYSSPLSYYEIGDGRLYKVKTDGSNDRVLLDKEIVDNFCISEEKERIYYYTVGGNIRSLNFSGTQDELVKKWDDFGSMFIVGDYLYIYPQNEHIKKLYRIKV